jgi:hypothetical protein
MQPLRKLKGRGWITFSILAADEQAMKEAITASVRMHIDDQEGILRVSVKKNVHIDVAEVRRYLEIADQLTGNKKALVLLDARQPFTISPEARSYSARHSVNRTAIAVISGSLLSTFVSRFFLLYRKPSYPIRFFSAEENALQWLKSFDAKK